MAKESCKESSFKMKMKMNKAKCMKFNLRAKFCQNDGAFHATRSCVVPS